MFGKPVLVDISVSFFDFKLNQMLFGLVLNLKNQSNLFLVYFGFQKTKSFCFWFSLDVATEYLTTEWPMVPECLVTQSLSKGPSF